jgi:hypothetical protein
MKQFVLSLALVFALSLLATAQKKYKPWNEWSEKEATKMLNDSPWGQTQTETNTSEMFFNPTSDRNARGATNSGSSSGGLGGTNDRNTQGALNQAVNVNFHIRFLSAKPVRQAFARRLILQNPQAEAQLKTFAEQNSNDWIVVAVDYDSSDQRFTGRVMQAFNSANLGVLANETYLERKDGKRIFLKDYKAPIADGMGAKFIFPRMYEEKPFVQEDSGYVRFYSEVGKEIKLNMRFKVSDMMFDGKLEY